MEPGYTAISKLGHIPSLHDSLSINDYVAIDSGENM